MASLRHVVLGKTGLCWVGVEDFRLMKRGRPPVDRLDNFITELLDGGLLRYDGGGAGRSHGPACIVVRINRQPHDDHMRIDPFNQGCRLDAIEPRHVDVHHDDRGLEYLDRFQCLFPITGFTDDFEVGIGGQDIPKHLPDTLNVVH